MMSTRNSHPDGAPRHRAQSLASLIGLFIPLFLGGLLAHHTLSGRDIWLHDRAGQEILATGHLPSTNSYSFTAPDERWVDHEWLFQVLVHLSGRGAEGAGKAIPWGLARVCAVLVLILILHRSEYSRRGQRTGPPCLSHPSMCLVAVVTLGLLWPRLILRPELFSYAGFVLAVRWIDRALSTSAAASAGMRWRSFVSPRHAIGKTVWLTIIWVQFHGFYILVPLLWLLALLTAPLQGKWHSLAKGRGAPAGQPGRAGRPVRAARWLMAAVLTFAAGALSPNGMAGLLYPFRALAHLGGDGLDLQRNISEMAPLLAASGMLGGTILVFKLSLVWGILWIMLTAGRVSVLRIVVWILAAAATLYGQRNLGFYALAFYLLHSGLDPDRSSPWLSDRLRGVAGRLTHRFGLFGPAIVWGSLLLSAGLSLLWTLELRTDRFYLRENTGRRFGTGVTPALYPFQQVSRLREISGERSLRLGNNIDCAGPLIQQRAGQVFIDGRTEVYPAAVWKDYEILKAGGQPSLEILARRNVEAVILAHSNTTIHPLISTLLRSPRWQLVDADPAGVLFLPVSAGTDADQAAASEQILLLAADRMAGQCCASADSTGSVGSRGHASIRCADRCLTMATLLKLADLTERAAEIFRLGLQSCQIHPILNYNYGNLLADRGDFREARPHFERALQLNGRLTQARVNLGICLFQAGDLVGAEKAFDSATRQNPRLPEAWVDLAEVRRRRGDRAGALAAYERALILLPGDQQLRQRASRYRAAPR